MKIQLPPFSLAFALSDEAKTGPSQAEEERLRLVTGEYLQQKLKPIYPSFQGLNFAFTSFQNRLGDPESKFQVYLEANAALFFEKGGEVPEKKDAFDRLLALFDSSYLSMAEKMMDTASSLTMATQVQANRLERGSETNVDGTVKVRMSDVYVAFTIPKCHSEPSNGDYAALVEVTRQFYYSQLGEKFDTFRDVKVSVRRGLFGMGKPNENYNVYIEWEFVVDFVPSEAGTVPGKHWLGLAFAKTDLNTYFKKHVLALKGTPFAGATSIFIDQVDSCVARADSKDT